MACRVPAQVLNGSVSVSLGVIDSLGNSFWYSTEYTELEISGGSDDREAPVVLGISDVPTDGLRAGVDILSVDFEIHDQTGANLYAEVYAQATGAYLVLCEDPTSGDLGWMARRISRDSQTGIERWRLECQLAAWAPNGTYDLHLYLSDPFGNMISLTPFSSVSIIEGAEEVGAPQVVSFSPSGGVYAPGAIVDFIVSFSREAPISYVTVTAETTNEAGEVRSFWVDSNLCLDSWFTRESTNADGTETWGLRGCPLSTFGDDLPVGDYFFTVQVWDVVGHHVVADSPEWSISIR